MPWFHCTACGAVRETRQEIAGRKVRCPACHTLNRMPPAEADAGPGLVEGPEPSPPPDAEPALEVVEVVEGAGVEMLPGRPGKKRGAGGDSAVLILRVIVWCVLGVWAFGVKGTYSLGMLNEDSAVRQAARAGDAAAQLVFGYVLAQAADHLLLAAAAHGRRRRRPRRRRRGEKR